MKIESMSRKVSGVLALAIILLVSVQQHRVNLSRANEQAADQALVKYQLENADLRMRVARGIE